MRIILALLLFIVPAIANADSLSLYNVTIKDGVFDPQSIEVPEGQRFKISVKNIGSGPAEFENLSMRVEKVLGLGLNPLLLFIL